jgi:hypothetical protein
MRPGINRFGLGAACGDYAVAGVAGGLAQMARRVLALLGLVLLVLLAVKQPASASAKGALIVGVAAALWGLTRAWRFVSARFGLRRCYLFVGGVVVTNLFGRPRGVVPWSEVTSLDVLVTRSLLLAFHRFEVRRRGVRRPLAFLALGMQPALAEPLLTRAAANGIGG